MKWKRKKDPLDRLMAKVRQSGECWEFVGANRNGYGAIGIDGSTVYTHRYVYERLIGAIPDGLQLDHLCRNRRCCNPAHLDPVTNLVNALRGARTGSRVSSCRRGHAYTPENTYTAPAGTRTCKTCRRERYRSRTAVAA